MICIAQICAIKMLLFVQGSWGTLYTLSICRMILASEEKKWWYCVYVQYIASNAIGFFDGKSALGRSGSYKCN